MDGTGPTSIRRHRPDVDPTAPAGVDPRLAASTGSNPCASPEADRTDRSVRAAPALGPSG
jgi:hypothetical protein